MTKKVLVIGELNPDLIVSGLTAPPTLGQEILASGIHLVLGSSSAICAAGLARLGAQVDLVARVGLDHYGDFVTDQVHLRGVGTRHIIHDRATPTGVTISLTYPNDRALVTYLGAIALLQASDVNTAIFKHYGHLHVSAYFLQRKLQKGLPDLFQQAHRAGLTVSLDTGHDPDETWGGETLQATLEQVDVFLPNEIEARAIAGTEQTEAALGKLAERVRTVVIKCGANGALARRDGQIARSPGFRVATVDTTGAGDSFVAGFLFAHVVQALPLKESLRFANACGALSTTEYGGAAGQPTLEQVQAFLEAQ
jgi:sugar/nucleoside kinase (ribokinase family)